METKEQTIKRNRIALLAMAFTFAVDMNKGGDMQADIMTDLFKAVDDYKPFLEEESEEKEALRDTVTDYIFSSQKDE